MKKIIPVVLAMLLLASVSSVRASVEGRRNTRTALGLGALYFGLTDQSEAAIASGVGALIAHDRVRSAKRDRVRNRYTTCNTDRDGRKRYRDDRYRDHYDRYDYDDRSYRDDYHRNSYYREPDYDYCDRSYDRRVSGYTPPQYRNDYGNNIRQQDYYYDQPVRPVQYYSPPPQQQQITITVTVIVR